MLMSERIKMSDTPAASAMRWSATGADCANAIVNRSLKLLAEQNLDISFIVNHENKQAHGRPPDLAADRELTKPITGRAALMGPGTARGAIKVPNLEPRAVCRASQPCGPPGRGTLA
jgi:hypothetical protein